MSTLLIIDYSSYLHKSVAVNGNLSHKGVFTGGVYGWLRQLCVVLRDVKPDSVVVVKDTRPYLREQEFDGYKGDRAPLPDDVWAKFQVTHQQTALMLEELTLNVTEKVGFEADDIAAWATHLFRRTYDQIVIASNDTDLYQLFFKGLYALHRGGAKGLYTREDFRQQWPAIESAEDWILMLSLTGTHNAVPGIKGVGEKTAYRAIQDTAKLDALMWEHGETIRRNRRLIHLPHPALAEDPPAIQFNGCGYEERAFIRFLSRWGITLQPSMRDGLELLA